MTRDGAGDTVSPAYAIDKLGQLAALGVDEHILGWHNVAGLDGLELTATEIVRAVAKLKVIGR